jgi:thermolysin
MKRSTLFLGALLLAACGGNAASQSDDQSARAAASQVGDAALDRLAAKTGARWNVTKHSVLGTTSHLDGRADGALVGTGFASAVAFLAEYKDIFSMRSPANELRLARERGDEVGWHHVRMQQVVSGIRVVDSEVSVHFDTKGALVAVDARYVPDLDKLDLKAAIDARAARAAAVADATEGRADKATVSDTTEPELVVYANRAYAHAPKLAYWVRVNVSIAGAMPQILVYAIDAKTGAVLNRYDDIKTMSGSGKGVKGDTKQIQVSQQGGQYVLVDTTRTTQNITTYTASTSQSTPGSLVSSTTSTSWDTSADAAGSAVDAHYNAGVVYDYYLKTHNRKSVDGNDAALVSTVHFAQQYDNAFWDGTQMVYGDGDGQMFYGFAAGLDVVGHELTHGVTQNESNLTYQDQSGALNEAVSDIMGCFVEHFSTPDPVKNWQMGENIGPAPTRDMIHPTMYQQPGHMSQYVNTSQDNGGVHVNSGIVNNADYLMTMGGANDKSQIKVAYGLGWDKSQKLWYLTNTQYLQSGSDFAAAAQATLTAAKSLNFTQNEQNIVECAWISVGVLTGQCQTLSDPATSNGGTTTGDNTGTNNGNSGDNTGSSNNNGSSNSGSSNGRGSSTGSSDGNNSNNDTSNGSSGDDQTGGNNNSNSGYSSGYHHPSFANTGTGGCAVTTSSAPDTGSLLAFGLALGGVVRMRRRRAR